MWQRCSVFLVLMIWVLVSVPTAPAACIKHHRAPIATGASPSGWKWSVEGTIGNNGGCGQWLFGMEFELQGAVNWGTSTGIPPGGHIGRGYQMDATDNLLEDGSDRVFSGVVNGEVAKILLTLSNNKHLTFRPLSPSPALRHRYVWLRDVRYFVQYYPPEAFVTGVATFSASGQMLYRDKTFEGF